jgi:hypothetical protein
VEIGDTAPACLPGNGKVGIELRPSALVTLPHTKEDAETRGVYARLSRPLSHYQSIYEVLSIALKMQL